MQQEAARHECGRGAENNGECLGFFGGGRVPKKLLSARKIIWFPNTLTCQHARPALSAHAVELSPCICLFSTLTDSRSASTHTAVSKHVLVAALFIL